LTANITEIASPTLVTGSASGWITSEETIYSKLIVNEIFGIFLQEKSPDLLEAHNLRLSHSAGRNYTQH